MKVLWFEGSSDDTFGMTKCGDDRTRCDDYDNCASGEPIEWRVWSPGEDNGVVVRGQYGSDHSDGWSVGVSPPIPAYEEQPMPAWNIHIEPGSRIESPRLVIEAPDDVQIDCLTRLDKGENDHG